MFRDGLRIGDVDARVDPALAPGSTLKFDGTAIVAGVAVGGGNSGQATLDFGTTPTDEASVVVTGQTWVTATSAIHAYFMGDTTADNTADDHEHAAHSVELAVRDRVVGVGFTISAYSHEDFATGQFTVRWEGQ